MKITYTLRIGTKEFLIEDEAATMQELFEKVAPMQALEIASFGREDVYLSFRTTRRDAHKYYALVSPADNTEFQLGVSKGRPGELFPGRMTTENGQKRTVRGWTRIQYGDRLEHEYEEDVSPSDVSRPEQRNAEQQPLIQTGKSATARPSTGPAKAHTGSASILSGKAATPSTFWAFQRANGLDESRAHAIVMAHTNPASNMTDWASALADLEALARAPERNPTHEKISAAMDKLAVLGVSAEDMIGRMARVADGVADVECLDVEQAAKVHASFKRWISELESGVQFGIKRGRAA